MGPRRAGLEGRVAHAASPGASGPGEPAAASGSRPLRGSLTARPRAGSLPPRAARSAARPHPPCPPAFLGAASCASFSSRPPSAAVVCTHPHVQPDTVTSAAAGLLELLPPRSLKANHRLSSSSRCASKPGVASNHPGGHFGERAVLPVASVPAPTSHTLWLLFSLSCLPCLGTTSSSSKNLFVNAFFSDSNCLTPRAPTASAELSPGPPFESSLKFLLGCLSLFQWLPVQTRV